MISYQSDLEGIDAEKLQGFFVGWPSHPSSQVLFEILQAAHCVELALDLSRDRVVGFAYAISDGILCAYIPLVEVLPEYQGRGIGSRLMKSLLGALKPMYMIDLVCDKDVEPFYARLGLVPKGAMAQRNQEMRTGRRGSP